MFYSYTLVFRSLNFKLFFFNILKALLNLSAFSVAIEKNDGKLILVPSYVVFFFLKMQNLIFIPSALRFHSGICISMCFSFVHTCLVIVLLFITFLNSSQVDIMCSLMFHLCSSVIFKMKV